MSCDEFLAEFGDYLENRGTPEIRQQLKLHLAECRTCQVLYDSTRKTLTIVMESGSYELPGEVSESIIDGVMEKIRRKSGSTQR